MKSEEYFLQENQNITEDNYKNIKNVLIKSFCFLFILAIIVGVIMNSVSHPYIYRIKYFFIKGYDYKSYKENNEIKKERLEKVKNIYESGYMLNKMNINYDEQNQMFNPKISNFNNNNYNIFNQPRNDDILANKISNINKINNEPLINSFNKNFTNRSNNESNINFESSNNEFNNINFLNNNNEFSGEKIIQTFQVMNQKIVLVLKINSIIIK